MLLNNIKTIPKGWTKKKIKDLLDFEQPNNYIVKDDHYSSTFKTPVLTANKSFILGYTNEDFGVYKNTPAIIFDDFTTDSKYVSFPFKIKSSAIKILKTKDDNADLKYVYEIMKSIDFPIANHKRHYISQYQEQDIVVPLLPEQKKIAEILSTVDQEIQKNDEIISKTEKLKTGLMSELFTKGIGHKKFKKTKIGNIPEEWNVVKGSDIAELITKGASPKWQGFDYQAEGTLFVTSENVRDGILDISNPKFLPIEFHKKLKHSQLRENDILINIVGASIGRSCLYKSNYQDANINQAVCLLRTNKSLLALFVSQFLQNPKTIDRLLGSQTGSARQNLSLTDIREFIFIQPSSLEQKKIVEILLVVDEKISVNKILKAKFTLLKKGLMSDLLTGKVRTI